MICYKNTCRDPDKDSKVIVPQKFLFRHFVTELVRKKPVAVLTDSGRAPPGVRTIILGRSFKIPRDTVASYLERLNMPSARAYLDRRHLVKEARKMPKEINKLLSAMILKGYLTDDSRKLKPGKYYIPLHEHIPEIRRIIVYAFTRHRDEFLALDLSFNPIIDESLPRFISTKDIGVVAKTIVHKEEQPKSKVIKPKPIKITSRRELARMRLMRFLRKNFGDRAVEVVTKGDVYKTKYKPLIRLGLLRHRRGIVEPTVDELLDYIVE